MSSLPIHISVPNLTASFAFDYFAPFRSYSSKVPFSIIVAATVKGAIGLQDDLPWKRNLPSDLKYFKNVTTECQSKEAKGTNVVIMGRRTWDSIPREHRPLKNRINIVLTSYPKSIVPPAENNIIPTCSLAAALEIVDKIQKGDLHWHVPIEKVFVIGGSRLYREALKHPNCEKIYLTQVLQEFEGADTFLSPIDRSVFEYEQIGPVQIENDIPFQFNTLVRTNVENAKAQQVNEEEMQYLKMARDIIESGANKGDRTGTGTKSLFGRQMRFSLRNGRFPLLTTKKVFWRGVVEELLWLVKGQTDSSILAQKNVHIWDDNGSRTFLDQLGFKDRKAGDLGPIYGFQWRHFGAKYVDAQTDYTGQGIDQLAQVIHTIKTNPNDRRIILSAWNVNDLNLMALPPCHVMCQFYVADGELSCQMYQRSGDVGLGVPFNIASYSLLTIMLAHICNLKPGEFVHTIGDAHVYNNHIEPLKQQIERVPNDFPTLSITKKRQVENIEDFTFDDFVLAGYKPQEAIKMQMAV